ncbi:MAG: hypothetical protein ACQJCO_00470 [cyanobacterium endosymbiont of Rhopalodia sterrenbergii]
MRASEGTRLIRSLNEFEGGDMKSHNNCLSFKSKDSLLSVAERLRFLISQDRRKQQNRQLSMRYRLASEV